MSDYPRVKQPWCRVRTQKHKWEFVGVDGFQKRAAPGDKRPRGFYVTFGCQRCGATVSHEFFPNDAEAELTVECKP